MKGTDFIQTLCHIVSTFYYFDIAMTAFLKHHMIENFAKILSWSNESKNLDLHSFVDWYLETPQCTTFRVNTLLYKPEDVILHIKEELKKKFSLEDKDLPDISLVDGIPECITIGQLRSNLDLTPKLDEVIVDPLCGSAVLRGAHVFRPGVMGMLPNVSVGTNVSIYVDLSKKCLKGFKKPYNAEGKLFVGNGIALMNRHQLFDGGEPGRGVAVFVTNPASGIIMFDHPEDMGVLQNFPSMVCVRALDPQPGEIILDMCAAPGNKATHIATLMKDQGTLIAIDRAVKVETVKSSFAKLKLCNCIKVFKGDSTKIVSESNRTVTDGPPFTRNSFDRILCDVPCSGSGQRPMLTFRIENQATFNSYAKLQKRIVQNAVSLLKVGGYLVYSTCSIFCEENESVIAWILRTYPEMELVSSAPIFGEPGLPECGLNEEERYLVQRFGPDTKTVYDSIGFFLAKLRKKG